MKKKLAGMFVVAAISLAAMADDSRPDSEMMADKMSVDATREEVSAEGVSLSVGSAGTLDANSATFRVDSGSLPRVMDLRSVRITGQNGLVLKAEEGTYYSELRTLVADSVQLSRNPVLTADEINYDKKDESFSASGISLLMSEDPINFQCSGGTLYQDGQPVPGNSTCLNTGSGSMRISCGEGGNRLRIELRDQNCPLE